MAQTPGNLPTPLTPFVGREQDLAAVRGLFVGGHRLVTVLGPGGAGKTRLVTEFGHRFGEGYDAVWFLDLTPFETAEDALTSTLAMFGVSTTGSAATALGKHLDDAGKLLLVVDNVEHVLEGFARHIAEFMRANTSAHLLATSREPLHILGESEHRLGALSVEEALALFEARARAQAPGFQFDSKARAAIVEVVERVDFLPLAIELAASRARMMTPESLAERLTSRMSALKSKDRDRPERHRTIAATIEWSWELLDENLRRALTDISVVKGTFDVEVAAAIFADPDAEEMIEALLDHSLLERVGGGRFRMFETVRGFAAERLLASSHARVVWRRHARYYVQKVEHAAARELASMRFVVPNLLAAAERDIDLDLRAACWIAAARVAKECGGIASHVEHLAQIPDLTNDPSKLAEAHYLAGLGLAETLKMARAEVQARLASEIAERHGHNDLAALALALHGVTLTRQGRPSEAVGVLEHAQSMSARSQVPDVRLAVRAQLASTLFQMGQVARAETLLAENVSEAEHLGDARGAARAMTQLGQGALEAGAVEQAAAMFRDAVARFGPLDDALGLATALIGAGDVERRRHLLEAAREWYLSAVKTAQASASIDLQVRALSGLAMTLGSTADRAHLVTALDRVGEDSDAQEAHLIRSRMAFFDMAFDNPPLARHAARVVFLSQAISKPWRATLGGVYALGYAMTLDAQGFDDIMKQARDLEAPGVFSEGFLDATQIVGDALLGRVSLTRAAWNELLDEFAALAAMPDPSVSGWPQWEAVDTVRSVLERRCSPDEQGATFRISQDGRTFYPPGADEPVDFTRRGALRLILLGLANHRMASPGAGISLDDIVELGWPGERVTPEAAASRVYTAIRTLRGFGLEEHLRTSDEGYFLAPELAIEFI